MARGDRLARLHRLAHRSNRRRVFLAITLGVRTRQRGLAQHVEGVAIVALFLAGGARQRAFDVAPHDELVAEDAHRLLERGARHGLAELAHQSRIPGTRLAHLVAVQRHHAAGEHQSPRRGIHQHGIGVAQVIVPRTTRNLVGNQAIRGFAIGNPQQRFGEAHEDHAFARGQAVLAQEGVERSATAASRRARPAPAPAPAHRRCAPRLPRAAPGRRGRVQVVVLR